MSDERFVRVMVECRSSTALAWGMYSHNTFRWLWSEAPRTVEQELGEACRWEALTSTEVRSIVDADESNTPDEAWAALAKWRLMQ